jgi:hypothetical protein
VGPDIRGAPQGSTPRFLRLAEADLPGLLASGSLPTAPDTKLYKSNTSGWKGEFLTTNGRYAVSIQAYGDRKHLGVFGTFAEACGAQWAAKSCYMVSTLEKLADRQRGPAMYPYFTGSRRRRQI